MPASVAPRQASTFLRELADSMAHIVRPSVVLDCAGLRQIDGAVLYLLLCCLEEAMKRNGDVRLARIPSQAQPAMKSMGLDRLFHCYPSIEDAVESFVHPCLFPPASPSQPESSGQPSVRAA